MNTRWIERSSGLWWAVFGIAAAVVLTSMVPEADAQRRKNRTAADAFKQTIVLSENSFPPSFGSEREFIAFVKKSRVKELWPEKKGGAWSFYYMAFLSQPNTRGKHVVTFYDITNREKPLVISDSTTYPSQGGQRAINGTYTLDPPFFKPDHLYLMTYSKGGGQVLAEVEFTLKDFDPERAAKLKVQREEEARRQLEAEQERQEKAKNKKLEWQPPDW